MGSSDEPMGSPRHPRPGGGFRISLVEARRDPSFTHRSLAGDFAQQVVRLVSTVRQGQRAQRLGAARFLVGSIGERGHLSLSRRTPDRGLPSPDVHDAGCRHRGRQPFDGVPDLERQRSTATLEWEVLQEGKRVHTAASCARALAHGRVPHHPWQVPSTICAPSWTVSLAPSFIGIFASR